MQCRVSRIQKYFQPLTKDNKGELFGRVLLLSISYLESGLAATSSLERNIQEQCSFTEDISLCISRLFKQYFISCTTAIEMLIKFIKNRFLVTQISPL